MFINGCFNWMIPNLYIGNGCLTKHPFKTGCLGYQVCPLVVSTPWMSPSDWRWAVGFLAEKLGFATCLDAWEKFQNIISQKTSMEPQNRALEDDVPFQKGDFQVLLLIFWAVFSQMVVQNSHLPWYKVKNTP